MTAELVVLGAGSILPRAGFGCAGYAVLPAPGGPVTLLDCGPGTVRALGAAGIELEQVRRVVFSHYHLDHCLDLFALAFARHNPCFDPVPPLELVGPVGLARLVEEAPGALGHWARDPAAEVHEVAVDGRGFGALTVDGLELTCARTEHTPEAVAWRVALPAQAGAPGPTLAYTGDSPETPRVAELARGVDLFVAECSFPDGEGTPNHLTPHSAARLAQTAGARVLLLSHFYPQTDPVEAGRAAAMVYGGRIELARDGARFALEPRRTG